MNKILTQEEIWWEYFDRWINIKNHIETRDLSKIDLIKQIIKAGEVFESPHYFKNGESNVFYILGESRGRGYLGFKTNYNCHDYVIEGTIPEKAFEEIARFQEAYKIITLANLSKENYNSIHYSCTRRLRTLDFIGLVAWIDKKGNERYATLTQDLSKNKKLDVTEIGTGKETALVKKQKIIIGEYFVDPVRKGNIEEVADTYVRPENIIQLGHIDSF